MALIASAKSAPTDKTVSFGKLFGLGKVSVTMTPLKLEASNLSCAFLEKIPW